MKRSLPIILIGVFSLFAIRSDAQLQLTVSGTQQYTNFNFTDADGNRDNDYIGKFNGGYRIGYNLASKSGIYFSNTLGIRKVGAYYNINRSHVDYDLQYAMIELGVGYHYKLNNYNSYGFYFNASPYYGYLIRANQRILDENYDIRESKEINVNDVGFNFKTGMTIPLSHMLDMNAGVEYMRGIANLEKETSRQEAKNYGFGLTIGLTFSVK